MIDILLDCLSETWLIIAFVLVFCYLAHRDEKKRKQER